MLHQIQINTYSNLQLLRAKKLKKKKNHLNPQSWYRERLKDFRGKVNLIYHYTLNSVPLERILNLSEPRCMPYITRTVKCIKIVFIYVEELIRFSNNIFSSFFFTKINRKMKKKKIIHAKKATSKMIFWNFFSKKFKHAKKLFQFYSKMVFCYFGAFWSNFRIEYIYLCNLMVLSWK